MTRERKTGWNRNEGRWMEMRERESGGDKTEESRKNGEMYREVKGEESNTGERKWKK